MRRRGIVGCMLLVVGAILAIEFVPIYVYDWIGGYDLTIHIDSPDGPPTAVGCMAERHREDAEHLCSRSPAPTALKLGRGSVVASPYDGKTLQVHITTSGRDSMFGRPVARYQQRFLVVSVEWPDGRRTCKVVEIPNGRESREVRVSIP